MLRSITAANPLQMERALAGLRAYQEAPRQLPPEPPPAIAESHGATLRDYGGSGVTLLFIPSLINPPNILDLGPERSLLRWLADQGFRVLLLDWGWDVEARKALSLAGHAEAIAVPFIRCLGEPPLLAGYCLGGTMAVAAAQLTPVRGLATLATPWRFSGFGEEARASLTSLWNAAQPTVTSLGLLPMEVLQSAFWSLDPVRTVAKFQRFASLHPDSAEAHAFVTLEDWANDGPPIPEAAAREMFGFIVDQDVPGRGEWHVGGRLVDPGRLSCPLLNIVSTTDRIVPSETAIEGGERLELAQGHVATSVGRSAPERLWQPLAGWLSRAAASC